MIRKISFILIPTILFHLPSLVFAGEDAKAQTTREDKVKFQQLLRDRDQVQSELVRLKDVAVKDRKRNGKESLETSSKIQSQIQKLDRIENRLMIIQFRHPEWEIPKKNETQTGGSYVQNQKEEVFQDAKQIVTAKFKEEAQKIGQTIQLPITRLAIDPSRSEGEN